QKPATLSTSNRALYGTTPLEAGRRAPGRVGGVQGPRGTRPLPRGGWAPPRRTAPAASWWERVPEPLPPCPVPVGPSPARGTPARRPLEAPRSTRLAARRRAQGWGPGGRGRGRHQFPPRGDGREVPG